tara:strand:- start:821 stop:1678 length:858 start_codon:yes stop_codon:yes gene_type:complete
MAQATAASETVNEIFNLSDAVRDTLYEIAQQLINYAPQFIGAAVLLLAGWALASALAISAQKLVQGLDSLFARVDKSDNFTGEQFKRSYARIARKLVFWTVMLFFFAVAANILGWDLFSGWFRDIVTYLPGIITGMVVILGGFLLSNLAKSAIVSTAARAGVQQSLVMAKVVQIAIIFSAIIIGVEQIGLNIGFLSNIILVIIAISLSGLVLAFSLGARTLVANIIAAQYLRRHCEPGDHLSIADTEGEVIEISQASIVLETETGKSIIPAKLFHEQVCHIKARQ